MRENGTQRRRLCIVTHVCRKNDGQGRVNYEIATAALRSGWHVTIVAAEISEELCHHLHLVWIKISAVNLPTNLLKYHIFAVRTACWLRGHGRKFDVLHVNGFITWGRSDVNTAHFVHSGWLKCGYFPYRFGRSLYDSYQRIYTLSNVLFERHAFKQARAVVAVSQKIAGELERIGVPPQKISMIPNGVDVTEFRPGPWDRREFGLPEDALVMLFAGDIRTSRKNLETVLRSMVVADDWHLAVAGRLEGSPYPDLAKALGIAARVHFLGMVKQVAELMRCMDAFVFPSRYEAMSLVLLEAMASGLPVLTARSAGGAEIIGDGGRVLENPDDAKTLAAWLQELAARPDLRAAMGKTARQIAEQYTWTAMGANYLSLYERLL